MSNFSVQGKVVYIQGNKVNEWVPLVSIYLKTQIDTIVTAVINKRNTSPITIHQSGGIKQTIQVVNENGNAYLLHNDGEDYGPDNFDIAYVTKSQLLVVDFPSHKGAKEEDIRHPPFQDAQKGGNKKKGSKKGSKHGSKKGSKKGNKKH